MLKADFYQQHLDQVSRSFAFCIRQLPSPLRDWVGLSYLLCRLVDTIEDAPWENEKHQKMAFSLFDRSLVDASAVEGLASLPGQFPLISEPERQLLADAPRLMRDYHALPRPVHQILCDLVQSMSLGMQHFSEVKPMRLKSLGEVNQYCFFVAGVVGELLAKLLATVDSRFHVSQSMLLKAHHFGLFLQKVNLLKDQVDDEKVGRHLVPSRELIEGSAQENAASAMEFLLNVPHEQVEFRRFCAWSLFLGLESLQVSRQSVTEHKVLKVSRARTEALLGEVELSLQDDAGLMKLFESFCESLGWSRAESVPAAVAIPDWLPKVYRGLLDANGLKALGVAVS